jgi:hypothetical protein
MKSRLLLIPVLVPLWLLGFAMAQIGENKHNTMRSRSTKPNLVTHIEESCHPTDEQEIMA